MNAQLPVKLEVKLAEGMNMFKSTQFASWYGDAPIAEDMNNKCAFGCYSDLKGALKWFKVAVKQTANVSQGGRVTGKTFALFVDSVNSRDLEEETQMISEKLHERYSNSADDHFLKNLMYSQADGVDEFKLKEKRWSTSVRAKYVRLFNSYSALCANLGLRLGTRRATIDEDELEQSFDRPARSAATPEKKAKKDQSAETINPELETIKPLPAGDDDLDLNSETVRTHLSNSSSTGTTFSISQLVGGRIGSAPKRAACILCGSTVGKSCGWRAIENSHLIPHAGLSQLELEVLGQVLEEIGQSDNQRLLLYCNPTLRDCSSNLLPTCVNCNSLVDTGGVHLHVENETVTVRQWSVASVAESKSSFCAVAKTSELNGSRFHAGLSLLASCPMTVSFWKVHSAVSLARHIVNVLGLKIESLVLGEDDDDDADESHNDKKGRRRDEDDEEDGPKIKREKAGSTGEVEKSAGSKVETVKNQLSGSTAHVADAVVGDDMLSFLPIAFEMDRYMDEVRAEARFNGEFSSDEDG